MRCLRLMGIFVLILSRAWSAEVSDGVYEVLSYENKGVVIPRNDTSGVVSLGRRIGSLEGEARIRSCSNDNSLYDFFLNGLHIIPGGEQGQQAVVIGGTCLLAGARGSSADGTFNLQCRIRGKETTNKVSSYYDIAPELRSHPGYRIETHWTRGSDSYVIGDPMPVTLSITNVGDGPVTFFVGGKNRGARDNQYHFLAYADVDPCKPIPDTGDPLHFGGLGTAKTLQPGEAFTGTVNLSKWFNLTEPGSYELTGLFDLDFMQNPNGQSKNYGDIIWNDTAAASFHVRVTAKSK